MISSAFVSTVMGVEAILAMTVSPRYGFEVIEHLRDKWWRRAEWEGCYKVLGIQELARRSVLGRKAGSYISSGCFES